MLIDWFTVAAQIVNFLALVALLQRFLFRPLVKAIDERKKKIETCLGEAAAKSKEAEREVELQNARLLEQERNRDEMLAEAKREADERRDQMIRKTREDVRRLESKWHEDLERERTAFLDEIRRRAGKEILAVVRRALADLAGSDLLHAAVEVLLEKLSGLDPAALSQLVEGELTVLSATELPPEMRLKIRDAIETRLGRTTQLRFQREPAMGWGIELRGNGRRIGWNVDAYVEAVEEHLKEALERRVENVVA